MNRSRGRRRLLSISHSYVIGLNRRLPDEMARLGADEWEVTAVVPRRFDDQLRSARYEPLPDERCNVRTVDVHLSREPRAFFWGRALGKILSERWDVVHLWEEPYVVGGIQPALMTPRTIPLVFATFQNIAKRYPFPFGALERLVVKRASGWIAYGETVAGAQLGRPGYSDRPMRKIPPAVDVQLFRPRREAGVAIRRQLGWDEDGAPTIGYLGRLVPEKGLSLLTETLDRVKAPWRVLIVGTGPLEGELRAWMKRYPRRSRLVTTVRHTDVPLYLNAMDVLAVPSQTTKNWCEQFGRMVLEAFACGVPVVSSDSGELPFTVGDAGAIVGESDRDGWVRTLEGLLNSSDRREDLAERGRERATSRFAWPLIARKTLDFLAEMAGQPVGRSRVAE